MIADIEYVYLDPIERRLFMDVLDAITFSYETLKKFSLTEIENSFIS